MKTDQQVKLADRQDRLFHIAGDGRVLPNVDARKQVGDYLVSSDFQRAYVVTKPASEEHGTKLTSKRLSGLEADRAIEGARRLYHSMLMHELKKVRDVEQGLIGTGDTSSQAASTAYDRVQHLQRNKSGRRN